MKTLDGSDTLLASIGSKGLLVDQHELQLAMDALAEQLQQPGWSADDRLRSPWMPIALQLQPCRQLGIDGA